MPAPPRRPQSKAGENSGAPKHRGKRFGRPKSSPPMLPTPPGRAGFMPALGDPNRRRRFGRKNPTRWRRFSRADLSRAWEFSWDGSVAHEDDDGHAKRDAGGHEPLEAGPRGDLQHGGDKRQRTAQ